MECFLTFESTMFSCKTALLAGISSLALLAADPQRARAQTPTLTTARMTQLWLEGGASYMFGQDSYITGLTPPGFHIGANGLGWEVAGGFDRRLTGVWHVVAQFRYARNRIASRPINSST